ncbi:SAE2-domain-containing protein [Piedraia hortae CBS 480.64]|uniref:SAE2-domain-containing protein n=1 Tax=Piedraia hortae CBS 480.64 TaxID=1314780 RepID=A0A6A7C3F2_9PEZI|nr:SAE2-domain-containing protein [Piedraia hortae CBS 480.64]
METIDKCLKRQVFLPIEKPEAAAVTPELYYDLVDRYNDLIKYHGNVKMQHASCDDRIRAAMTKYRQAKVRVKEWQMYIDRMFMKGIQSAGVQPDALRSSDSSNEPKKSKDSAKVASDSHLIEQTQTDITPKPMQHPALVLRAASPEIRVTSSQTTDPQCDAPPSSPPTAIAAQSDDEPTMVSVRTRKRRRNVPKPIKQEPISPKNNFDVCISTSPSHKRVKLEEAKTSRAPSSLDGQTDTECPRKALDFKDANKSVSRKLFSPSSVKETTPRHGSRQREKQRNLREVTPLRSRHLSRLKLDDFKINPSYKQTNYAFTDTFRGRNLRRCLQGCMRADCCGAVFLRAVELGGAQVPGKSDAEVMEAYLGPDWRTVRDGCSEDKWKDMVNHARATWMANAYGKHRYAFERRKSPPGFWRTDMPTTQEEAQDRANALVQERQKIEERWQEAMRNGRWKFKDE